MKKPVSLVLVTATNCQVGCKSCPAGRKESQPSGTMTLEMADRIISKACKESRVLSVCLYYFNEPFLLPTLVSLVKLVHSFKKSVLLSSNLSFASPVILKRLTDVLDLEPFNLIVSLSGWTQEVYERSHAGGDVEQVRKNLLLIKEHRKPGTSIRISWHRYTYNQHEEARMEQFVREELGEGFHWTPYGIGLLPLEKVEGRWNGDAWSDAESDIMVPLDEARGLCEERKHWDCHLQSQTLVVNAEGLVYNCGTRNNNENLRPSFFDTCTNTILDLRKTDPMCVSCKSKGLHIYGQQAYTIPRGSVARWAIERYKRTGLQGMIPALTRIGVKTFYQRPQTKTVILNLED